MSLTNIRTRAVGGVQQFFDVVTGETVNVNQPIFFQEDFIGAGHTASIPTTPTVGDPWIQKIVGAAPPTVGAVANAAGGQIALTLTSASQKQDAVLYQGDALNFDVTKELMWEARVNLSVLPSAAGVQTVFGLSSAWIDGPDNASYYLEFGATANGNIILRSQDGVTQNAISSAITVIAGAWHIYRIDATDVTNIGFYIDNVRADTPGSIAFAATGANAILQSYQSVYKPSGTGVATTIVDKIDISANRV